MLKKTIALFFILICTSGAVLAGEPKVILEVSFERNTPVGGGINHLQRMENKVKVEFNKKTLLSLENGWMLQILAKDEGGDTELVLTVLGLDKLGAKILAEPRLVAPYGKKSFVRWSSDGESLSLSVTPVKPAPIY